MNLMSCRRCGTVLDKDRIIEPDIYDHDTQELIPDGPYKWNDEFEEHSPVIDCPACDTEIFYDTGDES